MKNTLFYYLYRKDEETVTMLHILTLFNKVLKLILQNIGYSFYDDMILGNLNSIYIPVYRSKQGYKYILYQFFN